MYKRNADNWLKHWDFILLDMFCLQMAFLLAFALSGYGWDPYDIPIYRNMSIFIEVIDFLTLVLFRTMSGVLKRGYYREFVASAQQGLIVGALSVLLLFLLQEGQNYSRLALVLMVALYIGVSYLVRIIWKWVLLNWMNRGADRSLLIVTTRDSADRVAAQVLKNSYVGYSVAGLAILDEPMRGSCLSDLEVLADGESLINVLCKEWIDEALVVVPPNYPYPNRLIESIAETGVVVHYDFTDKLVVPDMRQFVEEVAGYTVVTTSMNYASPTQILFKRIMDIVIGAIGCVATGLVALFVAPAILRESPGPILFSQERMGKNGRRFKMYKFRSMYLDADERKEALLSQNKINDSKMFKLDFDPRVIGNEILPDGIKKTGIGDFIRRTSLDEFPQFFNVLKGEMSVVGTRPPLVSEANLYESHHRSRLAIKPGITGLWQISGRSNITDFEEVVRLDREYINNWSIGLDIKILLKTVAVVIKGEGSV